mgnify:CR=1 FL=1
MLWRPVFTLARNEKKIYALLKEKGIDAYLPLRTHVNIQPVISKGKNYCYKRKLAVPMFSNYLFACLSYDSCSELQRNRSVIRVLPVSDIQEDALMNELKMLLKFILKMRRLTFQMESSGERALSLLMVNSPVGRALRWTRLTIRDLSISIYLLSRQI